MTKAKERLTECARCSGPMPLTKQFARFCSKVCSDADFKARNKERCDAGSRAWVKNNRERSRQIKAKYRRDNPSKTSAGWQRRRAINLSSERGCEYAREQYVACIQQDPCVYCGEPSDTLEHISPLSMSGDDSWANLARACRACNSSKKTKDLLGFLLYRLM